MSTPEYVGFRLRQLREQSNMGTSQFACLTGLKRDELMRCEEGYSRLSAADIGRISMSFGVSADYFTEDAANTDKAA